jgi:uncharacterized lipoprotein YajG
MTRKNNMKYLAIMFAAFLLTGCSALSTKDYQMYVDSAKSISKDNTVAQTACFNAVQEIAKGGDAGAKVGAIVLAEKCKSEPVKVVPPKKSILSF